MNLYDAAVRALNQDKAIRRPSMPPGLMIVPVGMDPMRSFLVTTEELITAHWLATVEDLVAKDWMIADWRAISTGSRVCG